MATQVRETGGIYSVLNHAHLDELNPTQQEWCGILLLHAHARALQPAFDFGCAASSGVQSHASQVYIRREEPDGELPRKPGGHRRPAAAEQAEFFVKCPHRAARLTRARAIHPAARGRCSQARASVRCRWLALRAQRPARVCLGRLKTPLRVRHEAPPSMFPHSADTKCIVHRCPTVVPGAQVSSGGLFGRHPGGVFFLQCPEPFWARTNQNQLSRVFACK